MEDLVKKKFEEMGAEAVISKPRFSDRGLSVNVARVSGKQVFDLRIGDGAEISVVDHQPGDRHLLLLAKLFNGEHIPPSKTKFLCGHDEREWFTCQISDPSVATVDQAKLSLLPKQVRSEQRKLKMKAADRIKRKTPVSVRQGEWIFTPEEPEGNIPSYHILHNEPLQVGRSKPHIAEFACRYGGHTVYVAAGASGTDLPMEWQNRVYAGLTEDEKAGFLMEFPRARVIWSTRVRDPIVYVKGKIRHPDHKTLNLPTWHRVLLNTETRGVFNRFLD